MLPPEYTSLERDRAMVGAGGLTILMYHKIGPAPLLSSYPALYVSAADFARQLSEFAKADLPGLSLDALTGPYEGYCVTFDDGFRNVFDLALPILVARGVTAIQFIVAGQIGGTDAWDRGIERPSLPLMDEAQIREWLAAGQEIGAHTMTHPRLTTLPVDRARAEIFDSKHELEDRFGIPIRHFCYPYGDYNAAVRDIVAEAGYATACTITNGHNSPATHPLELCRLMACDKPGGWRRLANGALRKGRRMVGLSV